MLWVQIPHRWSKLVYANVDAQLHQTLVRLVINQDSSSGPLHVGAGGAIIQSWSDTARNGGNWGSTSVYDSHPRLEDFSQVRCAGWHRRSNSPARCTSAPPFTCPLQLYVCTCAWWVCVWKKKKLYFTLARRHLLVKEVNSHKIVRCCLYKLTLFIYGCVCVCVYVSASIVFVSPVNPCISIAACVCCSNKQRRLPFIRNSAALFFFFLRQPCQAIQ